MSIQGNIDDCYFYYYSTCTKGDDCPFRHCEVALGTETVCSLWREGRCFRENCKFRHMESRINRTTIPCYWEDKPSGCLKPHCVFLHRKPRLNIHTTSGNEGLILPISSVASQINHAANVPEMKDAGKNITFNPVLETYSNHMGSPNLSPTSHPVEPIVVSFDGEESDSESACSTPMKSVSESKHNSASVRRNLQDNCMNKIENNFGIKTLEQIKMEKIHKESEHFYKSVYDRPLSDSVLKKKTSLPYKLERYPPESDFVSVSDTPSDKSVTLGTTSDSNHHSSENESDFKSRLLKRNSTTSFPEKSLPPPKKVVSWKRNSKDDGPLNFKIKTLEEIRRERENKLGNREEAFITQNTHENSSVDSTLKSVPTSLSNPCESLNGNGRPFRRLKIKRQTKESLSNSAFLPEGSQSQPNNEKKENRLQMILHEVQNFSEDQNKSDNKGKRKAIECNSLGKNSKKLKAELTSPNVNDINMPHTSKEVLDNSAMEENQKKKVNCPIIKRQILTSTVSSPVQPNIAAETEKLKNFNFSERLSKEQQLVLAPKKEERSAVTSVDEIDTFLLNDGELALDYEPDSGVNETDDILLEIQQLLDS